MSKFKADIQAWLTKHNIPFDKKLLRPELLALAKANKPEPQYIIDDIAKEKGHIILRLPPYHPEYCPKRLHFLPKCSPKVSRKTIFENSDRSSDYGNHQYFVLPSIQVEHQVRILYNHHRVRL
jgi:hypothetical protein